MTRKTPKKFVVPASPEALTARMFYNDDKQVPLVSLELDLNEKRRLEQLEEMWRREVAKNEALQVENIELQRRLEQLEEMWRREVAKNEALQGNYQESQERVKKLEKLLKMAQKYYIDVLTNLGSDIDILFHREEEHLAKNGDDIKFSEAEHLLSSSSNHGRSEFSEKFAPPKMEVDSTTTKRTFCNRVACERRPGFLFL